MSGCPPRCSHPARFGVGEKVRLCTCWMVRGSLWRHYRLVGSCVILVRYRPVYMTCCLILYAWDMRDAEAITQDILLDVPKAGVRYVVKNKRLCPQGVSAAAYDVPLRPSSRKLKKTYGKVNSKTWKRWVSTGMEPAGSPVTVRDGDFSSPDAQRGTGG